MQRGSIRKRGATWTAYWFSYPRGQRTQHSKGGFRTKTEAQQFLNDTVAAIQRGEYAEPVKLTLGQYLTERWLPLMEGNLRPTTWSGYEGMIRNHVVPHVGHVALQELTADHLDALYAQLLKTERHGRAGAPTLSPKTVRHIHTVIQKALRDAVRKRLVIRNVAVDADPPSLRRTSGPEIRTWSADELKRFLSSLGDDPLRPAFDLAASTGMRRGEVLGLRWGDLDLDRGHLAVRQTVSNVRYELVIGPPKTPRSRRTLALSKHTVALLRAHRAAQDNLKAVMGEAFVDQDLVFTRPEGSPIHPDFFSQSFERAVRRAGLPRIRLHDLRHTHATLALAAGADAKVISDRLGHANAAFTLDVYTHAMPHRDAAVAESFADLVFGSDEEE